MSTDPITLIDTNTEADLLVGGEGDDTITVLHGAGDIVQGNGGNDTISVDRNVTVDAGSGDDTVILEVSADDVQTEPYGQTVTINGVETFVYAIGLKQSEHHAYRYGSSGRDTLVLNYYAPELTTTSISYLFASDIFIDFEIIDLSSVKVNFAYASGVYADTFLLGDEDDHLDASRRTERQGGVAIEAGGGNDTIVGSDYDDTLTGGQGDDVITGGDGTDTAVYAGVASSYGFALDGESIIVTGPDGTDTVSGVEFFSFTDGTYTLAELGAMNLVSLEGTEGDDQLSHDGDFSVAVSGLGGNDTITATGTGNYTIDGGDGDDIIISGDGDDTITGGLGNDDISGGDGTDTVVYSGLASSYGFLLEGAEVVVTGPDGTDRLAGIETYTFSDGTFTLAQLDALGLVSDIAGTEGDDVLSVDNSVAVSVSGLGGNDTITATGGAHQVNAGAGDDTIVIDGNVAGVIGGEGRDTLKLAAGVEMVSSIEETAAWCALLRALDSVEVLDLSDTRMLMDLINRRPLLEDESAVFAVEEIVLGDQADVLSFSGFVQGSLSGFIAKDITISAGGGNDQIYGMLEADQTLTLDLGDGADDLRIGTLYEGQSDELATIYVSDDDDADDTISGYISSTASFVVTFGGSGNDSISLASVGEAHVTVTTTGSASIELNTARDNTVIASGGAHMIETGRGNDTITSLDDGHSIITGAGNDIVTATGNNLTIDTGYLNVVDQGLVDGDDIVTVTGTGNVIATGAGHDNVFVDGEATIDTGSQGDTVQGGDGADAITVLGQDSTSINGGLGDDTILAGNGDDLISGNEGSDVIDGGAGDDSFWIDFSNEGHDVIDGGAGSDNIYIQYGFDHITDLEFALDGEALVISNGVHASVTVSNIEQFNFRSDSDGVLTYSLSELSQFLEDIEGTDGDDSLSVNNVVATTINGNGGDDTITAIGGEHTLNGGAGDDTFYVGIDANGQNFGNSPNMIVNGGEGTDTVVWISEDGGVVQDLEFGSATITQTHVYLGYSSIEVLDLSNTQVKLQQDSPLHLYAGIRKWILGDSADQIHYILSTDEAYAHTQFEVELGGGDDVLMWQQFDLEYGHFAVDLGDGADFVATTPGGIFDRATGIGGLGINGSGATFTITDNDDDTDEIAASDGEDFVTVGGSGDDVIFAGDGADEITVTTTGSAWINAGGGADTIHAVNGAHEIFAEDGDDRITIDGNVLSVDGGEGSDTVIASHLGSGALVSTTGLGAEIGATTFSNVETLDLSGHTSANVRGFDQAGAVAFSNYLLSDGDDTFDASGSNLDLTITGGYGDDAVTGGAGTDTFVLSGGLFDYTFTTLGANQWTVTGIDGTDVLIDIEHVYFAQNDLTIEMNGLPVNEHYETDGDDLISNVSDTGDVNRWWMLGGNDTIDLNLSNQWLHLGAGNDAAIVSGTGTIIETGSGNDDIRVEGEATVYNETGTDTISLGNAGATLTFYSDERSTILGDTGDCNISVIGSGDMTFLLGKGNDIVLSGTGNDEIYVSHGSNFVDAGEGEDVVEVVGRLGHYSWFRYGDGLFGTGSLSDHLIYNAEHLETNNNTYNISDLIDTFEELYASDILGSYTQDTLNVDDPVATRVFGFGGNDTISVSGAAHEIDAGDGDDRVTIDGSTASVDGGDGNDTLVLDLGNATLSSTTGLQGEISAAVSNVEVLDLSAQAVDIRGFDENSAFSFAKVILGDGNDTFDFSGTDINGAPLDLIVTAGGGDNEIHGGAGTDRLVFSGLADDYTFFADHRGIVVVGDGGTDIVTGIEEFEFADGVIDVLTIDPKTHLTDAMAATASQSSTHSVHVNMETFPGEDAYRVIDNDVTTHNHTNVRNGANSVTIDLNGDAFIEEIAIENGVWNGTAANRLVDATVKVLKDGVVVWHNVDDGNTALTREQYQTLVVEGGVVGDQILIENDTYIHLKEVDVFGNLNLTDVMNVTASSSSSWQNNTALYGAELVLDGDTSTFSHPHRSDSSAPTLEIKLGADAFIEQVMVFNRNDSIAIDRADVRERLAGATLEVLDDGEVVGSAFTLSGDLEQTIDIGGIVGDTIRFSKDGDYLHIAEVDVYGDLFV